jgi:hypothetical protein
MTKKYLKMADLVPPAMLEQFMSQSIKTRGPKFFDLMFDKYKEYGPCILRHSENTHQYSGAFSMLTVIFECLEKALNDQSKVS